MQSELIAAGGELADIAVLPGKRMSEGIALDYDSIVFAIATDSIAVLVQYFWAYTPVGGVCVKSDALTIS